MKKLLFLLILFTGCASEIWEVRCTHDVYEHDASGTYRYTMTGAEYYWDEPLKDTTCQDYYDGDTDLYYVCTTEKCIQTQHQ